MYPKRKITKEEKEYLLSIKPEDIDLKLLQSLFTDTYQYNGKGKKGQIVHSRFNTYDEFSLKKGEYFNKEDIPVTNCGLFIVNKFLFERDLADIMGYVNIPISKKQLGKINSVLDQALLEDKITTTTYIAYLNRLAWLAFTFHTDISTTLTIKSMRELPSVKKEKERLFKENKEKIDAGDVVTVTNIEKQLVDMAREEMKEDPSFELYDSGARGGFSNSYKNAQIMKGPVYNSAKGKFEIMKKPLAGGIDKGDIPTLANNVIDGSFSKANATGECGYLTKKIAAAFQSVVLGKPGSDCGTKGYSTIYLTNENFKYYNYKYIIEGSKLVRLSPDNKSKYIGKTVKMRSNMYCISSRDICNKCAGDLCYMLGITTIGLTASKISNVMLQKRMKVFHDSTVHTIEIDVSRDIN